LFEGRAGCVLADEVPDSAVKLETEQGDDVGVREVEESLGFFADFVYACGVVGDDCRQGPYYYGSVVFGVVGLVQDAGVIGAYLTGNDISPVENLTCAVAAEGGH